MPDSFSQSAPTPGRPADRREAIVAWFLERLVSGELKPGDRLPSRSEIRERFDASPGTVQDAMDELSSDGHIVSRSTSGTFVAERPPYLHRFGLVFLQTPDGMPYWSHFYRAMIDVAPEVASARMYESVNYFIQDGDPRQPDYTRFILDLKHRRLAGAVFTMHAGEHRDSPLMQYTNTPRFMIASGYDAKGVPSAFPDRDRFLDDAMGYLRAKGRNRVAVFDFLGDPQSDEYSADLSRFGLRTLPHWNFPAQPHMTMAIQSFVRVLLDRPAAQRPSALLVTDDNLVSAVSEGVLASGLMAPKEIEIVSLVNLPSFPKVSTPVTWFGFDTRDLIAKSFDGLEAVARKQPFPALSLLDPVPILSASAR